jgi:hypothetical protein
MVFTFITVPFVVIIEHLWLAEFFEAILQSDLSSVLVLSCLLSLYLGGTHTRQLLDEGIFEISMPKNVQDKVSLALSASIEANIIFDSNFMQHI